MIKKILLMLLLGLCSACTPAPDQSVEKQTLTHEVEQLWKVAPGTSTLMLQMGERYRNLYWAAKQSKWEFAEYQMEEIEELIKTLMITRPKRAATAEEFLAFVYPRIPDAIKARDWGKFQPAFMGLGAACMACHRKNDHGFIILPAQPRAPSSLVLEGR